MTKNQAMNILKEIRKLALEASLTGALSGGGHILANAYNSIHKKAADEKWIDDGIDKEIIPMLDINSDIDMDIVGCASALLSSLLSEENEE